MGDGWCEGKKVNFTQSLPRVVHGENTLCIPVSGWIRRNTAHINVEVDGHLSTTLRLHEPVPGRVTGAIGFAGEITLPSATLPHRHRIRIFSNNNGSEQEIECHEVLRQKLQKADPVERGLKARIAICMAVYNPARKVFQRQLDSIVSQQEQDWICIVNDDHSDSEHVEMMQQMLARDPRFFYFSNQENIGFYRNFEIALGRVPDSVPLIALSDQDDFWYPEKLSSLHKELQKGHVLVYSDARIVSEDGSQIEPGYWGHRINNYKNPGLMLVANTVTGAASLFKKELLDALLPFPPKVGDAFHDHWIACSALGIGSIGYVDRPLYDYYQYGESIIGHCGFAQESEPTRGTHRRLLSLLNPVNLRSLFGRFIGSGQAIYWQECRRIESICDNIRNRQNQPIKSEKALRLFGRGIHSTLLLLLLHLRTRQSKRITDNAELRLSRAYFVHSTLIAYSRVKEQWGQVYH